MSKFAVTAIILMICVLVGVVVFVGRFNHFI